MRWFAMLITLLLASCTSSSAYVKAYSGDDVSPAQLALLKPTSGVVILSIDNNSSYYMSTMGSWGSKDYDIALLPGEHAIMVSYDIGSARSRQSVELKFKAEAGRRYLIKSDVSGHLGQPKWSPKITDVTGKEKCWTVKVGIVFYNPEDC